jgi:hypothetical protein
MLHKVFGDDMPRTYATYANAEKALLKTVAKLGGTDDDNHLWYLIASTPAGRFYPVVVPSEEQVQSAITLAHNGVAFVRR